MFIYAQIDAAGICFAESSLSTEVERDDLIAIDAMDGSRLGRRWDGQQWHDVPQPEPPPVTRITKLAFRNRFTQPEKVALEMAALDNPADPMAQRQQAAVLRSYLKDLDASTFIDLTHPDTVAAVHMLEAATLIGAGRAADILGAPIEPRELPA